MAKVITFSRFFPAQHPRKGQPTYFVEKLNKSLPISKYGIPFKADTIQYFKDFGIEYCGTEDFLPKHHTIRGGNRWKAGDTFSPRVWSGKPYKSKQVRIAPDIKIEKVWDVQIEFTPSGTMIMLPTKKHSQFQLVSLGEVARNDGLTIEDFENWFNPKKKDITFQGQIICWNENIVY